MKSENNKSNMDIEDPKQNSPKGCHNMDPKHQKLLIGLVICLAGSVLIIGIVVGTTGSKRIEGMFCKFTQSM